MKARLILAGGLAALALGACVSTTTGPSRPEANVEDAAQQYYQLGARYYRNGNYDLARDRLIRALEHDPQMAIAHSTLALTYESLDVPRLARQHYELAVRYEPKNIAVRNTYAVFLCRQGSFDDARKQFDRVVKEPENDNPEIMLTNAGVCMAQKPDNEAAESYFRQALERKRNYPEALLQLALLKRRTGDDLAARAFLQRYMAVQPASASILYLAVQIEKDMGNQSAEMDYRRQLLEDFPESAEARRLLETG